MNKKEFIERVKEIIESGELDKLDELYEEIAVERSIETGGGETITVRWGTP